MKKDLKTSKKIKKPWPTKDAMEQVYERKLWGSNATHFYSGEGSHNPEIVKPYLDVISSFLSSFNSKLVVCDLGCGDFNVGKELVKYTKKYVAVDIVASLIAHNKKVFQAENLEFQCIDLAMDALPHGDCVLLRQVLQHVSNAEVQKILNKLNNYKYIVITEHIPEGDFIPNIDIISGQGIRLKKQSGVNILAAPFHFKVQQEIHLLATVLKNNQGIILTTLYHV